MIVNIVCEIPILHSMIVNFANLSAYICSFVRAYCYEPIQVSNLCIAFYQTKSCSFVLWDLHFASYGDMDTKFNEWKCDITNKKSKSFQLLRGKYCITLQGWEKVLPDGHGLTQTVTNYLNFFVFKHEVWFLYCFLV